jgi:hypothetical protein
MKIAFAALLVGALMLMMSHSTLAASPAAGTWDCRVVTGAGDTHTAVMEIQETGGKLSGKLELIDAGEPAMELQNLTLINGQLSFKVEFQGESYEVRGRVENGRLDGGYTGAGESGKFTGTRR